MQSFTDSQVIVNGKGLLQLLELVEKESHWLGEIEKLGIMIDRGNEYPDLLGIIFTLMGFPEDETLEDPDGFCRDWLTMGPNEDFQIPPAKEYLEWLWEQKKLVFPEP